MVGTGAMFIEVRRQAIDHPRPIEDQRSKPRPMVSRLHHGRIARVPVAVEPRMNLLRHDLSLSNAEATGGVILFASALVFNAKATVLFPKPCCKPQSDVICRPITL